MIASAAGDAGLNKIAILYCAEIGGCDTSTKAEYFEEAGLDVVYRTSATLAAPDYTAQCLNARNAGAEILLVGLDAQSVQRIVSSCGSVGYAPQYAAVSQAVNGSLASVAELDGMWAPQTTAPWFTTDIPAVAEFVRAVQQHAPGQQLGGSLMQGWVSGKLLEAAIRASDDPTTSEGIRQGLYRLQDEDLGGLTYPITFEEGAPNNAASLRACWWDVRLGGGEFVSPNNGRRTCP